MSKKEKFIKKIEAELENSPYKFIILEKYSKMIDMHLNSGKKISIVLEKLGDPSKIVKKEIRLFSIKKRFFGIFKSVKLKVNKFFLCIKPFFIKLFKNIKNLCISFKKNVLKSNSKTKQLKHSKKRKIQKNNKKKNASLRKPSFFIKRKKGSQIKKVSKSLNNPSIIKPKRRKVLNIFVCIFEIILFVILFYTLVLFMASLFAVLDGIKHYGIVFLFLSISMIIIVLLNYLNKKRLNLEVNHKFYFRVFILLLVTLSFSVAYSTYKFLDVNLINDVSEKYAMNTQRLEYTLAKEKETHLYFNSWYNNDYLVVINNKLENKAKIEIKYYEAFYDLTTRRENNNVYISLGNDYRDILSVYLENLKENRIYNIKELSRYLIRIYVSEEYKEKLIIHN